MLALGTRNSVSPQHGVNFWRSHSLDLIPTSRNCSDHPHAEFAITVGSHVRSVDVPPQRELCVYALIYSLNANTQIRRLYLGVGLVKYKIAFFRIHNGQREEPAPAFITTGDDADARFRLLAVKEAIPEWEVWNNLVRRVADEGRAEGWLTPTRRAASWPLSGRRCRSPR
jgi:hypothetical protein